MLADHTDNTAQTTTVKLGGISKTDFNCDRLDLVAESPFIPHDEFVEKPPVLIRTDFLVFSHHAAVSIAITLPALRGPPSI